MTPNRAVLFMLTVFTLTMLVESRRSKYLLVKLMNALNGGDDVPKREFLELIFDPTHNFFSAELVQDETKGELVGDMLIVGPPNANANKGQNAGTADPE